MSNIKTAQDVTLPEWVELAETAICLLSCARFMYWLRGSGKDPDGPDESMGEALDKMALALEVVGLPQGTTQEYEANLEDMLKSDKTPERWRQERELMESDEASRQ